MSSIQAKKLGAKYVLLDLLGVGGMAEVFRGKLLGDKGFQKPIVIKKLLPQVARDEEMTRLFIGEARLAALLQHENIATTFDFGVLEDNYFLAMEYLFGKDLYTVMQRAKESKSPLETHHALMIVAKICEGMDYAHNLKDLQNNPLNIIHRDLTPQNIFITYDGKVKIIDFGVAKAEMLDTRTRAGVVKGKISYMSPEQISGALVDSRSDIFSIGILLYEMISKRRMYHGDTATLIRKSITVEYEALETIIHDLPPQLYAILHKALSSDIEARYQSCGAMQSDIENLLFSMGERPDSRVLKGYMQDQFAREYESEQRKMVSAMESSVSSLNTEKEYPVADKTLIYDTTGEDTRKKTSFLHRTTAAIHSKWQENKRWYSLIASICFIAVVLFWSFAGRKEKTEIIASPPAAPVIIATSPPVVPEKTVVLEKKEGDDKKSAVRKLARQAEDALVEQRFVEAREFVDEGLALSPYNQKLYKLDRRIKNNKQIRIQILADKAEQRLKADEITTPEDDSALFYYTEIQKIDPDSVLVQAGFEKIADRYALLADVTYRRYDFVTTANYVQKGLTLVPDHLRLLELKRDLDKSNSENYKKGTEKNIEVFFKSAEENIKGFFSH